MKNNQDIQKEDIALKKDESALDIAIDGLSYIDDDIVKKLQAINESDSTISYLKKINFSKNKK